MFELFYIFQYVFDNSYSSIYFNHVNENVTQIHTLKWINDLKTEKFKQNSTIIYKYISRITAFLN